MNRNKLESLAISGSGFIFDPDTGATYNVNKTGLKIIIHLKEGRSANEIIVRFHQVFDASLDEIEADIVEFIQSLKRYFPV